jgi:hypothetical protein
MIVYVPDDAFWLVWILLPIPTKSPDLGQGLPCMTFTNHYHREEGTGDD